MHILFYTPAFPPFFGGGERYARDLALTLAARGQQLTIVTSAATREQELWHGVNLGQQALHEQDGPLNIIRLPVRPFPGGWPGLLLWRKTMVTLSLIPGDQSPLLERMARRIPAISGFPQILSMVPDPPSLIHGFNLSWEHALLAARDAARQYDVPFVVTPFAHFGETVHPAPHTLQRRSPTRSSRVALNATMDHQRRLLREAAAVLALTAGERDGFQRYNIHPQHTIIAGGGVDPPPQLPPGFAHETLRRHDVTRPYALFLGRMNHDKGAIDAARAIIDAARHDNGDGHHLTLTLAGRITPDFQRFYDGLDHSARAHLRVLGPVDEQTKHALLKQSAMLLLPSRAESFGIVILEAWQHAVPVIAARAGGIPGVVDADENGLLVPFGDIAALTDAVHHLLANPDLAALLGQRGQQKQRAHFTWDRVADRVLSLYQELST